MKLYYTFEVKDEEDEVVFHAETFSIESLEQEIGKFERHKKLITEDLKC
jgi:hypothetical protein